MKEPGLHMEETCLAACVVQDLQWRRALTGKAQVHTYAGLMPTTEPPPCPTQHPTLVCRCCVRQPLQKMARQHSACCTHFPRKSSKQMLHLRGGGGEGGGQWRRQ